MTDEATPPAPPNPTSAGPEVPLVTVVTPEASSSPAGLEGTSETGGPYRAAPPPVPAPPVWRPNYAFLAGVSIVSLAADLGSKWWAVSRAEAAKPLAWHVDVVHGLWSFISRQNRGGAWGLLQDEPESVRRPFFLGISVVAIVFIVSLYRKLTPQQTALKWGLPLVLGGALGNLVNRIQYNYVVDFIDFQLRWGGTEHHWPTFNIADVAIVVGVGLMAVDMFTSRRPAPTVVVGSAPSAPVDRERAVPPPFAPDAPASDGVDVPSVPGAPGADVAPKEI